MEPKITRASIKNVSFGTNVRLVEPCNLYDCQIGDDCFIGPFVEIQKGVSIGASSKIQSHAFVCELVTIGESCFISHGVMFVNDLFARRRTQLKARQQQMERDIRLEDHVSIGTNTQLFLPVNDLRPCCDRCGFGCYKRHYKAGGLLWQSSPIASEAFVEIKKT